MTEYVRVWIDLTNSQNNLQRFVCFSRKTCVKKRLGLIFGLTLINGRRNPLGLLIFLLVHAFSCKNPSKPSCWELILCSRWDGWKPIRKPSKPSTTTSWHTIRGYLCHTTTWPRGTCMSSPCRKKIEDSICVRLILTLWKVRWVHFGYKILLDVSLSKFTKDIVA